MKSIVLHYPNGNNFYKVGVEYDLDGEKTKVKKISYSKGIFKVTYENGRKFKMIGIPVTIEE